MQVTFDKFERRDLPMDMNGVALAQFRAASVILYLAVSYLSYKTKSTAIFRRLSN